MGLPTDWQHSKKSIAPELRCEHLTCGLSDTVSVYRYLLKVTISRGYGASLSKEFPFWVRNYEAAPEVVSPPQQPIKVDFSAVVQH